MSFLTSDGVLFLLRSNSQYRSLGPSAHLPALTFQSSHTLLPPFGTHCFTLEAVFNLHKNTVHKGQKLSDLHEVSDARDEGTSEYFTTIPYLDKLLC